MFKLDTGASVTVVPASMYSEAWDGTLLAPSKKIKGPDNCPLKSLGVMRAHIKSEENRNKIRCIWGVKSSDAFNGTPAAPHRVPSKRRARQDGNDGGHKENRGATCMVRVRSSEVHICVDLTWLNENVCQEHRILPAVGKTLAQLEGAKVFSKLDATSGFWQVPLHKDPQPLTTFITFWQIPLPATLHQNIFSWGFYRSSREQRELCATQMIFWCSGKTNRKHNEGLQQVLKRCEKACLTLNEKCEFYVERVKFLRHNISATGIEKDPDKISTTENMPEPRNVEEVRRFLGMLNYVSKFSSSLPALTKPLRDLLKSDSTWTWDAQQRTAFEKILKELSCPSVLALYCPKKETMVSADASS